MERFELNLQQNGTSERDDSSFASKYESFLKQQEKLDSYHPSTSTTTSALFNENKGGDSEGRGGETGQSEAHSAGRRGSSVPNGGVSEDEKIEYGYAKGLLISQLLSTTSKPVKNLLSEWNRCSGGKQFVKRRTFVKIVTNFLKINDIYGSNQASEKTWNDPRFSHILEQIFGEMEDDRKMISFNMFIDYLINQGKRKEKTAGEKYKEESVVEFPNSDVTKKIYWFDDWGKIVAVAKNKQITVINGKDYRIERCFNDVKEQYDYLAAEFIPAPYNLLAVANSGMEVKFYEYTKKNQLRQVFGKCFFHIGSSTCLLYSRGLGAFFSGTRSGVIQVWRPKEIKDRTNQVSVKVFDTNELKDAFQEHSRKVTSIVNNTRNDNLLSTGEKEIMVHQVRNDGTMVSKSLEKASSMHSHGIRCISYNEQNDFCVTAGNESYCCVHLGPLRIGRLNQSSSYKLVDELRSNINPIQYVHTQDNYIFTFNTMGCIKIWDVRTHSVVQRMQSEEMITDDHFLFKQVRLHHVGFSNSRETSRFISCGSKLRVFKYNASKKPDSASDYEINNVFFQSNTFLIVGINNTVTMYNALTNAKSGEMRNLTDSKTVTCSCNDGKRLFLGTSTGSIFCFNMTDGSFMKSLRDASGRDASFLKTNDYQQIIACFSGGFISVKQLTYKNGEARFYELFSSKKLLRNRYTHSSDVICVDTRENVLVTASSTEFILWDMSHGRAYSTTRLFKQKGITRCCLISEDYLCVSDDVGTVMVFRLRFPLGLVKRFYNVNTLNLYVSPVCRMMYDEASGVLYTGDISGGLTTYNFEELLIKKGDEMKKPEGKKENEEENGGGRGEKETGKGEKKDQREMEEGGGGGGEEKVERKEKGKQISKVVCKKEWNSHESQITALKFYEFAGRKCLLSASQYSVKLYDMEGKRIGELMQKTKKEQKV